eukprot:CAMPEP_0117878436 /NCGR_PEP_ID=MMETSP0950-20121206/14847_1 /TAXON_ID=44440 /ORGANISM="Chattonella subsalsa, Strain CCMP2191" /LENGTH=253 /DNA_ID=CAMNT_0005732739 /DNA_START=111 /DNA_END=869 /DNA_ORIENTATION=-
MENSGRRRGDTRKRKVLADLTNALDNADKQGSAKRNSIGYRENKENQVNEHQNQKQSRKEDQEEIISLDVQNRQQFVSYGNKRSDQFPIYSSPNYHKGVLKNARISTIQQNNPKTLINIHENVIDDERIELMKKTRKKRVSFEILNEIEQLIDDQDNTSQHIEQPEVPQHDETPKQRISYELEDSVSSSDEEIVSKFSSSKIKKQTIFLADNVKKTGNEDKVTKKNPIYHSKYDEKPQQNASSSHVQSVRLLS